MVKRLFFFFFIALSLNACRDEYNADLVPVLGVYDAYLVGQTGPFDLVISLEDGDDVFIDTAWDGVEWQIIKVDVDNEADFIKYFEIHGRNIYGDARIDGSGVFNDGSLQLDYEICYPDFCYNYQIIASKY